MEKFSQIKKPVRGRPARLPDLSNHSKSMGCSTRTLQNRLYFDRAVKILEKQGERFSSLLKGRNKTLLHELGRLSEPNLIRLATEFCENGIKPERLIFLARSARICKTKTEYDARIAESHPFFLACKIHTMATRYQKRHNLKNLEVQEALAIALKMLDCDSV